MGIGFYVYAHFPIVDLIPASKAAKMVYNAADIGYTIYTTFKPVVKLYEYCGTKYAKVFDAMFSSIDDLGLIDNIKFNIGDKIEGELIIKLGSNTTNGFLNYFSKTFGTAWSDAGAGR